MPIGAAQLWLSLGVMPSTGPGAPYADNKALKKWPVEPYYITTTNTLARQVEHNQYF